jgi:protein SCO1
MTRTRSTSLALATLILLGAGWLAPANAQSVAAPGRAELGHVPVADTTAGRSEPLPDDLAGVGITEHPDTLLPLDLEFTNEAGQAVHLRDFFDGRRPVVLNLAYFTCPMLCTLVLNGVVDAMNAAPLQQGRDFVNIIVSIDPQETTELARAKKASYLKSYHRPVTGEDWHFLVGREEDIHALAGAVGFGYRFDAKQNQFIHTACTFVCTPEGRVSRYLYGIEYEPQTFRLALLQAAQGKIGSSLDRLILFCYHYDAESGRYAPAALRIVQAGGVLTAFALSIFLVALRFGEKRRSRATQPSGEES